MSQDIATVWVGTQRNAVQIGVVGLSDIAATATSCTSVVPELTGGVYLSGEEIPVEWRGNAWGPSLCFGSEGDDRATQFDIAYSELSETHLTATFEIRIEGAAAREGQVLTASGAIDVDLEEI